MAYPPGTFKGSFWETDFLTQHGFDAVVSHVKEGQRSSKTLEDYLKMRARAEDEYSKALLKLTKSFPVDYGGLGKAVDELKAEAETEATVHALTAAKIQEEVTKLTEFREKQKEERKKAEEVVHKSHKFKADLYRKMLNCKNTYEGKFKAAEKAESDAEKLKFGTKPKEVEKARKVAHQCQASSMKADEDYKMSVTAVENARKCWVREHADGCDTLQRLEEDRIVYLRNMIWIFTNLVSDLCVRLDDSREKIRLVAELCNEDTDIQDFIKAKSTSTSPLQAVEYIPCGAPDSVQNHPTPNHNNMIYAAPKPKLSNSRHIYEVGEDPDDLYEAIYDYSPANADEVGMECGDRIQVTLGAATEDGWLYGLNTRTQLRGLLPKNYVQEV
ncbi:proline-serine-threonine phosphatase-interacting protein 1-like [Clavelina lepadiformis]|uniref:proline-serine-threonine phosphatase-interacting protein 1-like n=1 Tax=Clavelina lepadiformis TaxID=159417 RepID=UPI0040429151